MWMEEWIQIIKRFVRAHPMTEKYGVIQYPSEPQIMNDLSCETNMDSFLTIESIENYKLIKVIALC